MSETNDKAFSRTVGVAQLLALLLGFGAVLVSFGAKNEQLADARQDLETLATVVNDLARAQATSAVADASQSRSLEDILRRLDALERSRK